MQELIEWVRNHPGQTGKSLVIDKATELLEKEKEVIFFIKQLLAFLRLVL